MRGILKRMAVSVVTIIIGVYAGLALLLFFLQSSILFHPSRVLFATPDRAGLDFEDIIFHAEDGTALNGWLIPGAPNGPCASITILFCHGNAGNIGDRIETAQIYHALGIDTFLFDYRGYGKSEGHISESGFYADADAAWKFLTEVKSIEPERIVIVGRSLGGPVAANLASRRQPAGLILESTFPSLSRIAGSLYPFLPVRFLLRYQFPTMNVAQACQSHKLVLHAETDEIVPFRLGKELFDGIAPPKTFRILKGTHNDCYFTDSEYPQHILDFIRSLPAMPVATDRPK
jgi:fermentation-respiration switch protein FrsA (DUF1100 family)